MKNLFILFYVINISAITIYAAALKPSSLFNEISKNFSIICPVLNNNVLVSNTTKYLSNCKDMSSVDAPDHLDPLYLNSFLCVGILVADVQLCNSILQNDYKSLPQNITQLEQQIEIITKKKSNDTCTDFKTMALFNNTKIVPAVSKTILELQQNLLGPQCIRLCSNYQDDTTNEFCSIIYFIHKLINQVSKPGNSKIDNSKPNNSIQTPQGEMSTAPPTDIINNQSIKLDHTISDHVTKNTNVKALNETETIIIAKENEKLERPPAEETPISTPNINISIPMNNRTTINVSYDISGGKKTSQYVIPGNLIEDKNESVDPPMEQHKEESLENIPKKTQKIESKLEIPSQTETVVENKSLVTTIDTPQQNFDTDADEYPQEDLDDSAKSLNDDTNPKAEKDQEDINERVNSISKDYTDVEESNFFSYFMFISIMFIAGYVVYHNKQKILALVLEGRRDRNSRRRPSTSSYRKLNSNLEEAVTSKCSGSASHVIY